MIAWKNPNVSARESDFPILTFFSVNQAETDTAKASSAREKAMRKSEIYDILFFYDDECVHNISPRSDDVFLSIIEGE